MPAGPRLPRRSALALAAAGLVATAGCDSGSAGGRTPGAGSRPGATATTGADPDANPDADPDAALVDRVLGELTHAHRLASAAGLAGFAAMHAAHIEALDGTVRPAPRRRSVRAADVRRQERRLQARLVHAATVAESGALARLLASMSAAVSQRLAAR